MDEQNKIELLKEKIESAQATYITLNLSHEIYIPEEIADKSIA